MPIADLDGLSGLDKPHLITLAGIVTNRQERRGSRGRFAFITLSDTSGKVEVALFSEVLEASRELLETGKPLLITVSAQFDGDQMRLTAHSLRSLDEAVAKTSCDIEIHMVEVRALDPLRETLTSAGRGSGRVRLVIDLEDREIEMALPGDYGISPSVRAEIAELPGIAAVVQR